MPKHLVTFELRRIEIPPDASRWQIAAWLEAQVVLWNEVDSLLEEKHYDHTYYLAREQAGYGKKLLEHLAPVGIGSFPDNLMDVIRHLTGSVHKCEIPVVD